MSKNIILYTRVSTAEQADKGFSLPYQKRQLETYCKIRGFNVLAHFEEDYSAKTFDRPQWKRLKEFIVINKGKVDTVLCLRWDRFSRNLSEALIVIKELKKQGIEVNTSEQPLDFSQPDSKLLLAMYLVVPEIENDKNSIRTTDGSRQARMEGCWTGTAPFGYCNIRNSIGKSTLQPNEKAPIVQEAFSLFSKGTYSADELRKSMVSKGMKLSKMGFLNLLRNVVYIGKIKVQAWGNNEEVIVDGLHEAIIDNNTFLQVQDLLSGRSKNKKFFAPKTVDELPLRGFLKCKKCGGNLTGSKSKGRSNSYFYYHCNNNLCRERFRADYANECFNSFLKQFYFPPEVVDLYELVLEDAFLNKNKENTAQKKSLSSQIEHLKKSILKVEDLFVEGKLSESQFISIRDRYEKNVNDLVMQLTELKIDEKHSIKQIRSGISVIKNLPTFYSTATLQGKKKIIGSIFPGKLEFCEGEYRTARVNEVVYLLQHKINHLQKQGVKKVGHLADLSSEAPPVGLEPTTL